MRSDIGDTIDAEISRARLAELALRAGEEVWIVFRHIRLFPKEGRFTERDVVAEDAEAPLVGPDQGRGI